MKYGVSTERRRNNAEKDGKPSDFKNRNRTFFVAFLLPTVLWLIYHWENIKIERLEFLLNAMITSATTCSGFILTSVSILIGLSNTPLMKKINSTGASKELQYRYKENLLVGLALIIVSVLIGTNTEDKVIPAFVFYSYVWIIGAYLISTITACWHLLSIIDLAPKSERMEEEKSQEHRKVNTE